MPNIPEFHFRVPPRKIERVVKPVWDYPTIDRVVEHILGNKKMSVYQTNIHDINRDGRVTIEEMLHSIIIVNNLTVISVTPAVNTEVGRLYQKASPHGKASTPSGAIGGGGGGGY